ncbi:flavodoxin family protein [Streptomyces sp. NPDC059629]|uniref:flavodoxin family protein n=1 Tax=Streptomyces sp. NPDC059629 TaxID=3346889 RepID=UPI0036C9F14C
MKALVINCTLKKSPEPSHTEELASQVAARLDRLGVQTEFVRAVDPAIAPGVVTDAGDGDGWPRVHEQLLDAEIPVVASPTWLGRPCSVAQRVPERMDATMSETDEEGRPVAYNRVAGVAVTGNEDGAHHVISGISGALADIGYTIPGQAWPYWHPGPGPGPDYLNDERGRDWAHSTGRTMADNLCGVARALDEHPLKTSG